MAKEVFTPWADADDQAFIAELTVAQQAAHVQEVYAELIVSDGHRATMSRYHDDSELAGVVAEVESMRHPLIPARVHYAKDFGALVLMQTNIETGQPIIYSTAHVSITVNGRTGSTCRPFNSSQALLLQSQAGELIARNLVPRGIKTESPDATQ